ncbi:putative non-specific serine/threonine protein kinase [Helianthus annuus]|nr:putative non-specific serine/threonine protein kinase [Helianthus annuus]KAJ0471217.1 putative non-specific serine/threonine protein kinase [Helianthus annuus]KAJ0661916.1 putative non-specific serine/threonine protein kinase [Helianthus annuus]KAJ0856199.1 putative non-specific serine/threonine protein kinase [Helianthus annuus]
MAHLWGSGFFLFFIFATTNPCFGCLEHERQALTQFKTSLTSDPSNRLSSWTGNNCCQWLGVGCNNATRRVTRLDLRTDAEQLQGNELSTSLSELTHLSYLDLSGNYFGGGPIPEFIGLMTRLEFLNLSSVGFSGVVTHQIGKLSSLRVLDLGNHHGGSLELIVDDFIWLSRLLSLEYLDLSRVNVSGARDFDKVLLYMIPSLLELHLSNCELSNSHFDQTHLDSNLTRSTIQTLDLSWNLFEGEFPRFLQNLSSLRVLDLSVNKLNSSIPVMNNVVELNLASNRFSGIQETEAWRLCELKQLDLSFNYMEGPLTMSSACSRYGLERLILNDNKLSGEIPATLERLTSLRGLYLDYNMLTGTIPESLGNLTSLTELVLSGNQLTGPIPTSLGNLVMLRRLDLSENVLNGSIPFSIGRLPNLEILYLSFNSLSSIPFSIGNLSELKFLDLSSNLLQGPLPDSTGQLSKLRFLDISNNSLSGVVTEAHFSNTSALIHLAATSNHLLNFKISNSWKPPFQIRNVLLGSCKIESEFPPWIQTQKNLAILILSNTSLYGALPDWLYGLPVIAILDLSHNFLNGPPTNLPSNQTTNTTKLVKPSMTFIERLADYERVSRLLLLKNNLFNGSIPDSLCNTADLVILDLSRNMLSGNLPDCFGNFSDLMVLILSSNRLSGTIPSSLGKLGSSIQWLHLNNNSFHGELPETLSNCTSLDVLDLGENRFSGTIPKWIGEKIKYLVVLRLHNNNFTGQIPEQLCQNTDLQIMDFGENNLTGEIPRCFENIRGMTGGDSNLYFFGGFEQSVIQVMRGVPLEYTTIMRYVVNLDLSSNNLVGEIPKELTSLSGLLGLNLSNNHLTGRIPDEIGDLGSLMSLDLSANDLSGMIPQSMSSLTFISHLNLSYNSLSGRIPTGNQLQTLVDPWIYAGNNGLCGTPLPKSCSRNETSDTEPENMDKDDDDDDVERIWIYAIASGFSTGFIGFVGILVLIKRWRLAFFKFWRFM